MNLSTTSFTVAAGRAAMAAKESGQVALPALTLALLVAGCGGGGGHPGLSGAGALQTASSGALRVQYLGEAKPLATSSQGQVFVTTQAGSKITGLSLVPPQRLADTSIVYDEGYQVYTYNWNTGNTNIVPTRLLNAYQASWSHDGRIAFAGWDTTTSEFQIFTCYPDGSQLTQLTKNPYGHFQPSWSPDDSKIVYTTAAPTSHIYTVPSGGGSVSYLGAAGTWPSYSPDGTEIIYATATGGDVAIMPSTGGAATYSTSGIFGSFTPSGTALAVVSSGGSEILYQYASNLSSWAGLQAGAVSYGHASASPDGSMMAFTLNDGATSFVVTAQMAYLANITQIAGPNQGGATPSGPSWSPFLSQRTYIGTGGVLSTSASGFLWAQSNASFASLLAFTATTPSSASIAPQNTSGSGPLVYLLSADNISSVTYTDSYYLPATSVTAGTSQVLVTIGADSGQIATIAPFIKAKRSAGAQLSYTGQFTAVYDAKGKNLAPHGASTITLDGKTGKLLSSA